MYRRNVLGRFSQIFPYSPDCSGADGVVFFEALDFIAAPRCEPRPYRIVFATTIFSGSSSQRRIAMMFAKTSSIGMLIVLTALVSTGRSAEVENVSALHRSQHNSLLFSWGGPAIDANDANATFAYTSLNPRLVVPCVDSAVQNKPQKYKVVFKNPATFRTSNFTCEKSSLLIPQAIIYEGMTLEIDSAGKYSLRGQIEIPATDVTLRLQFRFWQKTQVNGKTSYTYKGSVTLPPIHLTPTAEEIRKGTPVQKPLEHAGYSQVPTDKLMGNSIEIERIGIVEVGAAPSLQ
jgi:hypothetical protein